MDNRHSNGARMVVTGAAQGIGRALARRAAFDGARLVINDIEETALSALSAEIGAHAVACDSASASGSALLVERAIAELGGIDIFFANAGINTGGGLDASEDDWERSIEVNLLSHVRLAKQLVPLWMRQGGGKLVVTASAAGLLTMLGSAPYSVTKHGAVAFAEWLSATYGDRGVTVQVVCPQGVRTRILDEAGSAKHVLSSERILEPEDVADTVFRALDDDRFLILPHPEVADYYRLRATSPDRWLAGMRRIQSTMDAQAER